MNGYYTHTQLSEHLGIAGTTVSRHKAANPDAWPKHVNLGRIILYKKEEVERLLENGLGEIVKRIKQNRERPPCNREIVMPGKVEGEIKRLREENARLRRSNESQPPWAEFKAQAHPAFFGVVAQKLRYESHTKKQTLAKTITQILHEHYKV
jgi:hypothetical protein